MGWVQDMLAADAAKAATRAVPESEIRHHALSALRRLSEPDALMAMRPGGPVARIARRHVDGGIVQTYEMPGDVARIFAERGWITQGKKTARDVLRFHIAPKGRAALASMLATRAATEGDRASVIARAVAAAGACPAGTQAARTMSTMWAESLYQPEILAAVRRLGDEAPPVRAVVFQVVLAGHSLPKAAARTGLAPKAAGRFLRAGLQALAAAGWGA